MAFLKTTTKRKWFIRNIVTEVFGELTSRTLYYVLIWYQVNFVNHSCSLECNNFTRCVSNPFNVIDNKKHIDLCLQTVFFFQRHSHAIIVGNYASKHLLHVTTFSHEQRGLTHRAIITIPDLSSKPDKWYSSPRNQRSLLNILLGKKSLSNVRVCDTMILTLCDKKLPIEYFSIFV